jgi:antitoxin component YwqK of YwqJK toxin-antitoxin module
MFKPPFESYWRDAYFITQGKDKIKILSYYKDGKRDGPREYYSINGKLYKIEKFSNGNLESTQFAY